MLLCLINNPYYLFNDNLLAYHFNYYPMDIYIYNTEDLIKTFIKKIIKDNPNQRINILIDCHGIYGHNTDETYFVIDTNARKIIAAKSILKILGKVVKNPIYIFSKVSYDTLHKNINILPKNSLIVTAVNNSLIHVRDFFNEIYSEQSFTDYLFEQGFDPIKLLLIFCFNKMIAPASLPIISKSTTNTIINNPININIVTKINIESLSQTIIVKQLISHKIINKDFLNDLKLYLEKDNPKYTPYSYCTLIRDIKGSTIKDIVTKYQPLFPRKLISYQLDNVMLQYLTKIYEENNMDFEINPFYVLAKDNNLNVNNESTPYITYLQALAIIHLHLVSK